MHKSDRYLAGILLLIPTLLFVAHYLRYQHNVVLEQDGYQLVSVNESQTIAPHKEPIVFITTDTAGQKQVYKFNGYPNGDFSNISLTVHTPIGEPRSDDEYFIDGFKNSLSVNDTLPRLSFEQMYDLVHNADQFVARQLIQHTLEPGVVGYIDTMPLIFIFLGFAAFLIFGFLDILIFGVSILVKTKWTDISLRVLAILLFLFLSSFVRLVPWFPTSSVALFARQLIVVIPLFVLVQYLRRRSTDIEVFWKYEFLQFVLISIGGIGLLLIGNAVGYAIDLNSFDKVSRKPFFCTFDSLAIGFLLSIAIGLLLRNVVVYLLKSKATK